MEFIYANIREICIVVLTLLVCLCAMRLWAVERNR